MCFRCRGCPTYHQTTLLAAAYHDQKGKSMRREIGVDAHAMNNGGFELNFHLNRTMQFDHLAEHHGSKEAWNDGEHARKTH
jgi:hypothetical protein